MNVRAVFIILFCALNHLCISQSIVNSISDSYLGTGAYSNHHLDAFSIHSNCASLSNIKTFSAGIYGERKFLISELSFYDAIVAFPTHSGNFGLNGRYFGFSSFNEMQWGVIYARHLGAKAEIGVQFNYYSVRAAGYGQLGNLNFSLGTILHLTDKLNAGVNVFNSLGGRLSKYSGEKLPSIYSAALGFEASPKFFFGLEIKKEEDKPVNVISGLQYKFLPQVFARAGVCTSNSSSYFGIGFHRNSLRFDAIAYYHLQLGITPGFLMLLSPIAKTDN